MAPKRLGQTAVECSHPRPSLPLASPTVAAAVIPDQLGEALSTSVLVVAALLAVLVRPGPCPPLSGSWWTLPHGRHCS
ncbi:uncharacterized protein G2W53_017434 [Senna tora]|uniref:Uncharacterized protein n=1 Tax=Senna tora TaxID=362788 RepID=A0A834TU19_9FABA|nr:uncharacterized protein G2W53_017434 [Senna tora]